MAYSPDLHRLLTSGAKFHDDDDVYVVEPHRLDDVVLPTGQVVGCDPLVDADEATPFTVSVPPGSYPLRAWVAVVHHDGQEADRRVAALQLVIADEPVASWQLALTGTQDPSDLVDDEFYGYGVDSGTGTLADLTALRELGDWDYDRLEEVYIPDEIPEAPVPGAISAVTDEATGGNVVTVQSGWGDGAYPTFVGYGAAGTVVCFVTDFMVVPD